MKIKIHPQKLVWFLSAVMVVLTILHIWSCLPVVLEGRHYPIGYFNFDVEGNLPTLFATFLLGLCAFATFVIGKTERRSRKDSLYWGMLAVAFFFLAIDEAVMIHDKISEILRVALGAEGLFYFAWVIPYAVLLVGFVLAYLPFFLRLPSDTRKWIGIAAVLYVTGGIGFELPGGARYEAHGHDAIFYLLATFEELLEFSGSIVFVYAFFSYIDAHRSDFRLRITSS